MAINKNALIRYKTIDHCLQNKSRKWSLEDLITACNDALYEYEGIDGVSKRTVQADIQIMRSNKLGYNAPIIVVDRKYYTYEDENYSITNIPLSDKDLTKLGEAVEFLKQFQGFSHFKELNGMVQKLEDQIYSQKTKTTPVIDFEKNENLKGLSFLDFFYQAIIKKQAIEMIYKSFKARNETKFIFHAYLLKEINNRWFIIGRKNKGDTILNLAIDRVVSVNKTKEFPYKENKNFDAELYYKNAIGVSVSPGMKIENVKLFVTHLHAPYIITKPLHWSQKEIERNYYGVTISLEIQHNFELEKKLLGFGDGIKVLEPTRLKRNITERLKGAIDLYDTDISNKGLKVNKNRLEHKGFNILNQVFTQRSLKKIDGLIYNYTQKSKINTTKNYKIEDFFTINENISGLLHSITYVKVLKSIADKLKLKKATYYSYDNSFNSEWRQGNHSLNIILLLSPFNEKKGGFKLYTGSHKKVISNNNIQIITESNLPYICDIPKNGTLIYNSQLIHKFFKNDTKGRLRFICLEYEKTEL